MTINGDLELSESSKIICSRCNNSTAATSIRNDKNKVCEKCFLQYVTTKAVKRMETYKSRSIAEKSPQKLLIPISFGPSSTSLLYILDNHLQGQLDRMGRTNYELLLVHVDLEFENAQLSNASAYVQKFKNRFPRFAYLIVDITQALKLDIDWKSLGLEDSTDHSIQGPEKARLNSILDSMSSATSKADLMSTIITRLLVDTAKKNNCESILFGDSATRLAEKTLIETAKGRGFSLPWQVSDGISPYGVNFLYPLRDLLKKELLEFSTLTSPSLTDLITYNPSASDVSISAKSTTIDHLMAQYFETVEEKFPAVVANVVRTSSKLRTPPISEFSTCCALCGLPVADGTDGIYGWGGDQSLDAPPIKDMHHGRAVLCYGCSRSING